MTAGSTPDDKKIIIDEDWKSQVEREKSELSGDSSAADSATSQAAAGGPSTEDSAAFGQEPDLPPASLTFLISTMAAQAMAAMGQLPDPMTGKPEVRLKFAKHHIDMLSVLQEKTRGNASAEEEGMLEDAVHQLRMMYVSLESQLA